MLGFTRYLDEELKPPMGVAPTTFTSLFLNTKVTQ